MTVPLGGSIRAVHRESRSYGRAVVAALILATMAIAVPPALADNFGTNDSTTGPFADDASHDYCWGPGFDAALKDNANNAMSNLDIQTVMTDLYQANCDVVGTDIWWFDADLPPATRGLYHCVTWVTYGSICNSADVKLDPAEINIGSNDELDTTKSACHEVGHSVGMAHSGTDDDCMRSGEIPNTNVQYQQYNSHHRGHINDRY